MDELDYMIEEAINPAFEDELRMSLLDDILNESSLFKLMAMKKSILDSPLRSDQGLNVALGRRIEAVNNND